MQTYLNDTVSLNKMHHIISDSHLFKVSVKSLKKKVDWDKFDPCVFTPRTNFPTYVVTSKLLKLSLEIFYPNLIEGDTVNFVWDCECSILLDHN